MLDSPSGQTRTPPHLKWLLNERAMLLGEVRRREARLQSITAEVAELRTRIEALDSAMALFEPSLNPSVGGSVKATKERYGGRGGLTQFLLSELEEAGDSGKDTVTLTIRAAAKFGVPLETLEDRHTYRDTISWTLRYLRSKGKVEPAYTSKGGHVPSVWRRTTSSTFDDLRDQARSVETSSHVLC